MLPVCCANFLPNGGLNDRHDSHLIHALAWKTPAEVVALHRQRSVELWTTQGRCGRYRVVPGLRFTTALYSGVRQQRIDDRALWA
jgi:hypothetical protein